MAVDSPTAGAGTQGRLPRSGRRRRRAARAARARTPRTLACAGGGAASAGAGRRRRPSPRSEQPVNPARGTGGLRAGRSQARKVPRAGWRRGTPGYRLEAPGGAIAARAGRSMRTEWARPDWVEHFRGTEPGERVPAAARARGAGRVVKQVGPGRRRRRASAGDRASVRRDPSAAAVHDAGVECLDQRVADTPDRAIVKIQPIAVASLERVDVQMDGRDRAEQHFEFALASRSIPPHVLAELERIA